jgi:thiol-disulfide isomerase/thioredoxin
MFGHEIILIPNDTVRIYMTKEPLDMADPKPWTRKLSFSGKNRFIYALFDSLSYHTQDVMSHMLNLADNTAEEFIRLAEERYNKRVNYLKGYGKRHDIPVGISDLAFAEIYSAYVKDLAFLQGALSRDSVDIRHMINPKIDRQKLMTPQFFRTVSAEHVTSQYLRNLQIPIKGTYYNNDRLVKGYDLIMASYNGSFRDDLLSNQVTTFIKNAYNLPDMTKVIERFRVDCKDLKAVQYVDSLVKIKEGLVTASLSNILESKVQGLDGDFKSISDIIKGKPTLIDCWASWCNPCIAQFPSSKLLEQDFKDKVNFVYLSFDDNLAAWKAKSKELGMTQLNYHVAGGFKSLFSEYFSITTIPRYILIDAKGNLVSKDTFRPSNPKLSELLKSLL